MRFLDGFHDPGEPGFGLGVECTWSGLHKEDGNGLATIADQWSSDWQVSCQPAAGVTLIRTMPVTPSCAGLGGAVAGRGDGQGEDGGETADAERSTVLFRGVFMTTPRTIAWIGDLPGHIRLIDQTLLPARLEYRDCHS